MMARIVLPRDGVIAVVEEIGKGIDIAIDRPDANLPAFAIEAVVDLLNLITEASDFDGGGGGIRKPPQLRLAA